MEGCEGWRREPPVFLLKAGGFILEAMKFGIWNLKTFFSISLGIHLAFFSLTFILFPEFKIDRLSLLNLEISLLSFIPEAKMESKNIDRKEPITTQPKNRPPFHEPGKELASKTKPESEPLPPVQAAALSIPPEEPKPLLPQPREEKQLMEPIATSKSIHSPPEESLALTKEETLLSLKRASSRFEDVSIASARSSSGERPGNPFPKPGSPEDSKKAVKREPPYDGRVVFTQPGYAENPRPHYPPEARKRGYEGEVVLRVEVLSNGRVGLIEIKKSSGYELFDRSALATVKQWKFIPAKKGEEPIALWVNIPIQFQIK